MGAQRVLYIARGRGRGHALAGLAIAEELTARCPGAEVHFVSYGTGAETFRKQGHAVFDLELPDRPGLFGVESKLPLAFKGPLPSLVVAHEEFDVAAAARARGVPCVLVTDWFTADPESWRMQSIKDADQVLFLDDERVLVSGVFLQPEYLAGKVRCTGPVLRPRRYQRSHRLRARQEAGIPLDALVVSVFIYPGRRSESVAPLAGLLQDAFNSLKPGPKLLLWDRDSDFEFDRIMAASDLAITKGNRNIVLELAALGVPTISVSHGLNVIDDIRTASLANNRTVRYAALNQAQLAGLMREMIAEGQSGMIQPVPFDDGASLAGGYLADWLRPGL